MRQRKPPPTKSRILPIERLSFEEYRERPELNCSHVKLFKTSPNLYHLKQTGALPDTSTKAQEHGAVGHALILEGRRDFYVRPDTYKDKTGTEKPWNGNAAACKDWYENYSDKTVLSLAESQHLEQCRIACLKHKFAGPLLVGCDYYEGSVFGELLGRPVKCRFDGYALGGEYLLDLKFCANAAIDAIQRQSLNLHYYMQAAWYVDLCRNAGLPVNEFYFVFLEKSAPPQINVRRVGEAELEFGRQEYTEALEQLAEYELKDRWPDYTEMDSVDGEIPELGLPSWVEAGSSVTLTVNGQKIKI